MALPTLQDTSVLNREITQPDWSRIGEQLGKWDLPGGYQFQSGGNIYESVDTGRGTRTFRQVGSVAQRSAQEAASNLAKQQAEQQRLQAEAIKPSLDTLRGGIPLAQEAGRVRGETLQGELSDLETRYQSVLSVITGAKDVEMQRTQTGASRELGKRGISLQSGVASDFIENRTLPVSSAFASQIEETGGKFADIKRQIQSDLENNPVETDQRIQAINQTIAQMQKEGAQVGIEQALQLYQMQMQESQFGRSEQRMRDLAQLQADTQTQLNQQNESPYTVLGEGQTLYNLLSGQPQYTAPKSFKSSLTSTTGDPLGLF